MLIIHKAFFITIFYITLIGLTANTTTLCAASKKTTKKKQTTAKKTATQTQSTPPKKTQQSPAITQPIIPKTIEPISQPEIVISNELNEPIIEAIITNTETLINQEILESPSEIPQKKFFNNWLTEKELLIAFCAFFIISNLICIAITSPKKEPQNADINTGPNQRLNKIAQKLGISSSRLQAFCNCNDIRSAKNAPITHHANTITVKDLKKLEKTFGYTTK